MIQGEDTKDKPAPAEDHPEAKRKPIVIGELKTDEEARLAAEIEKLRRKGAPRDHDNDA